MKKQKMLIADSDDLFRLALADALRAHCQILSCRDGQEALFLLRRERPDILVLDLLLPKLDGISLLRAAARDGVLPRVFATTAFVNGYIMSSLESLDICYIMRKPCDIAATAEMILQLQPELTVVSKATADPKAGVSRLLRDLGFSSKLDGYTYLLEAIPLFAADPAQSFTKELYPAVGQRHGRSAMLVERNIRNAIATTWSRRDDAVWKQYFPADSSGCVIRPTNGAFIARLAEALQREIPETA